MTCFSAQQHLPLATNKTDQRQTANLSSHSHVISAAFMCLCSGFSAHVSHYLFRCILCVYLPDRTDTCGRAIIARLVWSVGHHLQVSVFSVNKC